MAIILGIESSCDETAAAVWVNGTLLSNEIATQPAHALYGGVVPEVASRAHTENIVAVVDAALTKACISKSQLDGIAFTQGPGLMGALLVGGQFSKGLAQALAVPLIGVNHMQAHILAHFIEAPYPTFPFLCLTVSGGHTQIIVVKDYLDMTVIGQTLDDAVGEAFDKTAKLLGLPYPGGPLIDKYAQLGTANGLTFPISKVEGYDFSFSGVKTAIMYYLRDKGAAYVKDNINNICAAVQHTLVATLMQKLTKASQDTGINTVAIAGGVAANTGLRQALANKASGEGWVVHIPAFSYCTDNAAMIAITGAIMFDKGLFSNIDVKSNPAMPFIFA